MLSRHVPDLAALQMLTAVRDAGSISAAARLLSVSQQALSARVRRLEVQVGSTLVARGPQGAALTRAGELVCGWGAEVLAAAERLDAGIASLRGESARRLHVAASQTIAEHLLPQWLVALRGQQERLGAEPAVVRLTVTNSETAASMVRSGDAVVGFMESSRLPHDLSTRTIGHDDLLLVVGPGHPWARRTEPVAPDELARTPLVMREAGSGTRESFEDLLAAASGLRPAPPALELTTTAAVRSAIAAGEAPGVLGRPAVRDDVALHRLVVVPVAGLRLRRPLTAVWAAGRTPPAGPARDLVALAAAAPASFRGVKAIR